MSSVKRTGLTGHSSLGVPGPPTVSAGPFYPDLQARLQQEPTPPQQKPAFFFPKADCPEKDPGNPGYPLQVSQCLLRKGNPGIGRWWVGSGIPGNLPSASFHPPPSCPVPPVLLQVDLPPSELSCWFKHGPFLEASGSPGCSVHLLT